MKKVCSWCGHLIDAGHGNPGEFTSHGICATCAKVVTDQAGEARLELAKLQLAQLHPSQDPRD